MSEKGIITIDELDARKEVVAQRVEKRFLDEGMGVDAQDGNGYCKHLERDVSLPGLRAPASGRNWLKFVLTLCPP